MNKLLFTRGSTFLIPGQWNSGDLFTAQTEITGAVKFNDGTTYALTCTKTGDRTFEIYAAATATLNWPLGDNHNIILSRADENALPNGDTFVEILEPFRLEVR